MTKIKHYPPITIGFLFVVAALAGIHFLLEGGQNNLKIIFAFGMMAICGILIVSILVQLKKVRNKGEIEQDEFTSLVRLHAGNTSFSYSMFLWFLLSFVKDHVADSSTLVSFGLMGSVAMYFICIVYFARSANFGSR